MSHSSALLVGLAFAFLACSDAADERAGRDELVGHYQGNGLKVDVDSGLAVVRKAELGSVVLWSSAPEWSATLHSDTATIIDVEVRNLIPGSTLDATGPNGEKLDVQHVDAPLPTRRRFAFEAPATSIRLTLLPPIDHPQSSFRFAVLSDIQSAIDQVQDVYGRIAAEPDVDFVLSAGDLTSTGALTELELFEAELESLPIPFYSTIGNHELATEPPLYQGVFGRVNVHFHYREAAFSLVDSGNATLARRTLDWLDTCLAEDKGRIHVFATHHPPVDPAGFRNGSFASRTEAHQLIAKLAQGRVDVSFHGHIHSYYEFAMAQIPAYISGGGGAVPEQFDGIGRHFLVVDVGRDRIVNVQVVRVD